MNKYRMPVLELAGGLGGGLLMGALGSVLGRLLGGGLFPTAGAVANNFGDLIGALLGFGLSYPLGVAVGMALIRRNQKRPGAFWPALAGAVLGAGLVLVLTALLSLSATPWLLQLLFVGVPPLIALIGVRQWITWTAARTARPG